MECLKPTYLVKRDMVVPCGRCAFCAATRRSDWATRIHFEARKHIGSKFITLTYSDNNLTWKNGKPQLVKADLRNWFKRVRKAGYKCRYYAVGEYGARTYRPHYHVLLFGDIPDRVLEKAWSFQNRRTKKYYAIGHVHIGKVSGASVNYCLGYMVNGKHWTMKYKREAPFCTMSLRPGLGVGYLTKAMIEWHKSGRKNYVLLDGERRHLPRYYKERIFSKLDRLRIAVSCGKDQFNRMVAWIRHPLRAKMRDPLAYYDLQRTLAARRIKFKCKENLII